MTMDSARFSGILGRAGLAGTMAGSSTDTLVRFAPLSTLLTTKRCMAASYARWALSTLRPSNPISFR
ncbi:hypothetical protein D3C83_09480 [compost metagenome]